MTKINKSIIQLKNVNFFYGKKAIIENANIDIEQNSFYCIIGENGSGKTTLLKLMIGLLKPRSGTIQMLGTSPNKTSHLIGHIPQKIHFDKEFPISVLEVVLMGRIRKQFFFKPTIKDIEAAKESLSDMNMLEFENYQFSNLSGGQQQRVLIARAITNSPKILFFDEPTNGIDALSEGRLISILQKLKDKMTIVMVSHNVRFVSDLVEKVICIKNGNILIHKAEKIKDQAVSELDVKQYKLVNHNECKHSGDTK